jgi:hypothetical protein
MYFGLQVIFYNHTMIANSAQRVIATLTHMPLITLIHFLLPGGTVIRSLLYSLENMKPASTGLNRNIYTMQGWLQ